MRSNFFKDLLQGLEIATTAAKLAAGLIEERKPQKTKPSKPKARMPVGKESVGSSPKSRISRPKRS